MVKQKNILLIGTAVVLIMAAIFFMNYSPEKDDFSINTILLKLNIPLNGEAINKIKITNDGKKEQQFKIYLTNLKDVAFLAKEEFVLKSGESKEIEIRFKDNKNEVKVYSGELIVESSSSKKKVPIILSVESEDRVFAITQENLPQYSNVYPGGKFGVDIKIFNLKDADLHSINIKYSIKNLEDELILSEQEELIVRESLGVTKIINIPETLPKGNYVFVSSIEYKETKTVAAHLFSVSDKEGDIFSGDLRFFVIIVLIFIVCIIALFFYFMKTREDLMISLKKQQNRELKRNSELIKHFENKLKETKKTPQRKEEIKELKKVRKKIIKNIKVKQKTQKREFKKLKKEGKKTDLKKKMKSWDQQGYEMFETKKEMKKISKKDMGKYVSDLKRKGFDTSVLNK